MKKTIIFSLIALVLLIGIAYAQAIISFPSNLSITMNPLPPQLSSSQILFNCPYDTNIEYRMVGIRDLSWSGTVPQVVADIQYWTNNRSCAGSKSLNMTLPITLSQQALVTNLQTRVNALFLLEAQSNHQPVNSSSYVTVGGIT